MTNWKNLYYFFCGALGGEGFVFAFATISPLPTEWNALIAGAWMFGIGIAAYYYDDDIIAYLGVKNET